MLFSRQREYNIIVILFIYASLKRKPNAIYHDINQVRKVINVFRALAHWARNWALWVKYRYIFKEGKQSFSMEASMVRVRCFLRSSIS